MAHQYKQSFRNDMATRFDVAPMSGVEFSKMTATPTHLTTFNAGDIVPIYCQEVLPNDTFDIKTDFVIRQTTSTVPVMANMTVDYYAFFVPNRIVNESWKNVQGENSSGMWVAPDVVLAPLYPDNSQLPNSVQVPVGSVADYYGFPTQEPIPANVLRQCHDLKFRGYLAIYNEFFRDQNYQPPIPFSKLNLYNGFFEYSGASILPDGSFLDYYEGSNVSDGSYPAGALNKAINGEGANPVYVSVGQRMTTWSALDKPLKANKHHDYFTSVLPTPQKGRDVNLALAGQAPIRNGASGVDGVSPIWYNAQGERINGDYYLSTLNNGNDNGTTIDLESISVNPSPAFVKLVADLENNSAVSVSDIRMSIAIQQTYELMARGGTRYREFVKSFFGIETDDPFSDVPKRLGHFRRDLDLYQTAQTSASIDGSTPQGNLTAFGYTSNGGSLFHETFMEHGYIHIFAVVRHKNVYSSYLARDNFRLSALDFYTPTLANISEQPVYTREINPFNAENPDGVFGYQEAWSEYRYEQSTVSAGMRPGVSQSLSVWNFADPFDDTLSYADGEFMRSNSEEVLNRSLAVSSTGENGQPQFKGMFRFIVEKQRPMPTYSIPGLDII